MTKRQVLAWGILLALMLLTMPKDAPHIMLDALGLVPDAPSAPTHGTVCQRMCFTQRDTMRWYSIQIKSTGATHCFCRISRTGLYEHMSTGEMWRKEWILELTDR